MALLIFNRDCIFRETRRGRRGSRSDLQLMYIPSSRSIVGQGLKTPEETSLFALWGRHSIACVRAGRRSKLLDYSRDEKKAECERKEAAEAEKIEKRSKNGNEEEKAEEGNEGEEIRVRKANDETDKRRITKKPLMKKEFWTLPNLFCYKSERGAGISEEVAVLMQRSCRVRLPLVAVGVLGHLNHVVHVAAVGGRHFSIALSNIWQRQSPRYIYISLSVSLFFSSTFSRSTERKADCRTPHRALYFYSRN